MKRKAFIKLSALLTSIPIVVKAKEKAVNISNKSDNEIIEND